MPAKKKKYPLPSPLKFPARRRDDGSTDQRYLIRMEWTGGPEPRITARFEGAFIGSADTYADAQRLCAAHHVRMMGTF
jgi:hypothetical protein